MVLGLWWQLRLASLPLLSNVAVWWSYFMTTSLSSGNTCTNCHHNLRTMCTVFHDNGNFLKNPLFAPCLWCWDKKIAALKKSHITTQHISFWDIPFHFQNYFNKLFILLHFESIIHDYLNSLAHCIKLCTGNLKNEAFEKIFTWSYYCFLYCLAWRE